MDLISLPPPFQIYPGDRSSSSLPFGPHQSGETRDLEISQQDRLKDLLVKPCIIGSEIECLGDLVGKLYSDSSVIDSVELVSEALDHVMEGVKLNKIRLVICYKENIEELIEKLGSEWSPSATFPTEHPSIRLLRLPCAQNRENEIEILLLPKEEPHPLDTHRDPSILLDVWMACGEATEWKMDHAENDRSSDQLLELWRSGGARDAYQRYFLAEKLIDAWSREGGFLTHLRDEREQRKLTEFLITQCGDFPRVAFAHFDRKGWEKKEGAERLNWLLGLIPRIRSVERQEQIWNLVERLVKEDKNGILVILNAYKNHLNNPYLQTVVPKLQALLLQKGVSSPQCIDRVDEWLREIERDEASRTIWEPLFSNWIKTLVNGGCCDRACRWISETHTRLTEGEQRLAQLQRDPREYLKQTSYAQFLRDREQFGAQAFSRLGAHILKGLNTQKMIECHPIIYSILGIHWIEGRENPRAKFCTDYLFHLIPYLAIGRSKEWAVALGKLLVQLDKWPAQGVVDRLQLHLFEVLEKGTVEDVLVLLKKQSFIQLFKKDALFEAVFKGFKKRSVPLSLYCKAIDELREAEWQKNAYMELFRRYSPILDKAGTEILLKKVPSVFGMMGGDSDITSALATIGKTSLAVKRHWIKPLIFPENPANSDNCALSNSLGIYLEDEKIEKSERAIALLYLLSEMLQEKGGEFELPINRIGEALREIGQFNSHRERVESCLDRIMKCANDPNYSLDFEWSLLAVDCLLLLPKINSSMAIDWMNLLMGNGVCSKKNYSEKVILALRLFERVYDRVDLKFKIKLSEWILQWIAGGNKKNCPSSQRLYHLGGSIALIWDETCEFSPEEDYTSLCEGVVSNAPYWAKPFLLDCIPNCVLTEWSIETQMELMDLKEWRRGSSTRFLSLLNSIESKLEGRDNELHRHFEKNVIDVCQGLEAKDLVVFLNSKELSWLARMKVWSRLVRRGMSEKGALALICQLKKMHPKMLFEKSARIITSDNLVEDGLKAIPRRVKR
ncbi:MAG: hypothetical protein KDK40_03765, partial [Chlamydiia bacterium]|nr:hypothetical protein [Chlamydiia bacterium]